MKSLNTLQIGKEAKVLKVDANKSIRRRLLDIGLVSGTIVKPILISPGKDMVAYLIKGAVVAIRKDDTDKIMVEEV